MNTQTIRSIAFSAVAAIATLTFTVMSVPSQADGPQVRGLFASQVYRPNAEGRMVQLGVPGLRSIVFSTGG